MGQPNLFVEHHMARHKQGFDRIGTGWEDTLTDQLAFLLTTDDASRAGVVHTLLGDRYEPVHSVETQCIYGTVQPDLVFRLASGQLLLVESSALSPSVPRLTPTPLRTLHHRSRQGQIT